MPSQNDNNDTFCEKSNDLFAEYYAKESASQDTLNRFKGIKDGIKRCSKRFGVLRLNEGNFDVADIGCGAGTQCQLWANDGNKVYGIDINENLISVAKKRAASSKLVIDYYAGSAMNIPLPDASVDICLVPELLEHVDNWQQCLDEFARILRPNGILFISTSNRLCPRQNEFTLPLYSWYPAKIKNYFVKKSLTSNPELVNYAKFPAVNWFTSYQLKRELNQRSFAVYDRFDVMDIDSFGRFKKFLVRILRSNRLTKYIGFILLPSTIVFGIKTK